MSLAIHEFERGGRREDEAVDAFLAAHPCPIVEGRSVTFVYRGEADAVFLEHWIYGLPSRQPFTRIAKTSLWYRVIDLPARSRVEYKLAVVEGGGERLIEDPLNPLRAHDPFGTNSVCHGLGYETPGFALPDPEARPGDLEEVRVDSAAFSGTRRVGVYLPARFRRTRRYPLLIVHDGQDYLRYSSLRCVLDNLIHRLEVAPLIAVLVQTSQRLTEYADDPAHARFLTDEIVPAIAARYPLIDHPASRGLMGASFGAVASLSTAWRRPGYYGRLLLQSGSFAFTDVGESRRGPVFEPVVRFMNRFRESPGRPSERVFLSCGMYESLIYENRSLVPLLQETGMSLRFVEARDGHNWENWRDRLEQGLSWLFPGPLLMVYE